MREQVKKVSRALLCAALILHASACGTLMHPERKGQTSGSIDVGVAILDGLGLLFFIIPGVIAFAVDFSNGTIYLPSGKGKSPKQARFDRRGGKAEVERIIKERTGVAIRLDGPGVRITRLNSLDEMPARRINGPSRRPASLASRRSPSR